MGSMSKRSRATIGGEGADGCAPGTVGAGPERAILWLSVAQKAGAAVFGRTAPETGRSGLRTNRPCRWLSVPESLLSHMRQPSVWAALPRSDRPSSSHLALKLHVVCADKLYIIRRPQVLFLSTFPVAGFLFLAGRFCGSPPVRWAQDRGCQTIRRNPGRAGKEQRPVPVGCIVS